mmetsp:Transcript_34365/g.76299  ORF Transcript_34365/g.76299 Transcript_34365/m.76299 type:complete len:1172 (-) Transcript_34365:306-3821(-)|eukprot:CAMPEP_0202907248 /NCGR_PEP_ID=MMETSP1392-20130828/41832_1 /ASSEMBLY_ACC=CAM_ASM_000868 /TAXON_ID=225041 /ORGANISM="Chlamydomonas chlamydogama, Strain SAG 11-48b" /LENGTH=1171 /DNA_ID=CAMNT_0049596061 /DNA_START=182 /DNA_END=3697 /DNA_ORIENTATION=-
MGTMGDSTKRRMAAAMADARAGLGGTRSGFNPGASVGGYAGGMGGTFGKAARGLGLDPVGSPANPAANEGAGAPPRPASAGRVRPSSAGPSAKPLGDGPIQKYHLDAPSQRSPATEVRKARPASAGAKNVWNDMTRELPKAPPHALSSGKVRPKSATVAKTTKPLFGVDAMEYKLVGQGLEANRAGGGARGAAGGSSFGSPAGPPQARPTSANYSSALPSRPADSVNALQELREVEGQEGLVDGGLTEAHLMILEDAIRDALRMRRSVYEGSKEMLLRLFKAVDDGSGDVSLEEFCAVCAQLGVSVSIPEAQGLFRRNGYEAVMPYQRFAHALLTQPARQMAEDLPSRKGAFQAGANANFSGKILYKQCRKPVYTPTDWDPRLADRSAELPLARLVLEFVYGYEGKENTAQNLFYTSEGKVVYYSAGVGVVYQRPPVHHQYFFLGHNDDITAVALCPASIDYNGKQFPAKTIVATGQVTSTETGAYICVWDSRTGSQPDGPAAASEITRIQFDKDARGFCALAFSPSGTRLVAVAMDNYHTVYVYDWRKNRELCAGRGQMGDPPQVYGVEWNPYEITHSVPPAFITFGRKHIKMWTCSEGSVNWAVKPMSFGRQDMQNVTSVQWLPPRGSNECLVVAGTADGQLYIFKGNAAVKAIAAHRPGFKVVQSDGQPAFSGVRGLRVIKDGTILLSGGADGTILRWDTSDGNLQESRFAAPPIQLKNPFGLSDKSVPAIRSLDYSPDLDRILVGTSNCDVLEVSDTTDEVFMDGHPGDVYFIAFHPNKPNIFATVSDSGHIRLWDAALRQMTHCAPLGWVPRAVTFSNGPIMGGPYHVAVGGLKGQLKILDEGANLRPLHEARDSREGIADLKYSPNNRFLAVAEFDTNIDIYSVEKGYQRISRCTGHSSTVRSVDWSTDSSIVMSTSNDYEILFWNAKTGKQITLPQRDVEYQTYTGTLGFPVMGIWPPYSDGSDINALDRAHNKQWCVTSDDGGMVKLFNYPCVVEDAPHRAYRGHSSHVMCVRFNCNDALVCSVGGRDRAIFQFRVVELRPDDPPPAAPQPVWGPLDSTGRNWGWTTSPATLTPAAASAAAADGRSQQPAQQHTAGGPHASAQMPAIAEEDTAAVAGTAVARGAGRPPLPRSPPPPRQPSADDDDELAENPAPLGLDAEASFG